MKRLNHRLHVPLRSFGMATINLSVLFSSASAVYSYFWNHESKSFILSAATWCIVLSVYIHLTWSGAVMHLNEEPAVFLRTLCSASWLYFSICANLFFCVLSKLYIFRSLMSPNLSPFCGGTYKLIGVLLHSEVIVQDAFATEGFLGFFWFFFWSKSDALRDLVCHLICEDVMWSKKRIS